MSKALELIRTLIDGANEYEKETGNTNPTVYLSRNNLLVIEKALLKAQESKQYVDELKLVEKKLKALEIIKEKKVNVGTFIHLTKILKKDYEQCKALNNTFGANICDTEKEFLTEEEFDTLKEVLE